MHKGITIVLKKQRVGKGVIRKLCTRSDELRGRGGGLIMKNEGFHIAPIPPYFTQPKGGSVTKDPAVDELLNWLQTVLDNKADRASPTIYLDGKAALVPRRKGVSFR